MNKHIIGNFVLVIFFGILFFACGKKIGSGGILSVNKMKVVLWDVMLADEFNAYYLPKNKALLGKQDSLKLLRNHMDTVYNRMFSLHQINTDIFFNSFDYYRQHPNEYKILLDSISAYGNRQRENQFMKQEVPEMQKVESLKSRDLPQK